MTVARSAPSRRRVHPAVAATLALLGLVVAAAVVEAGFRLSWRLPPWFAEFGQAGMYAATADGDVGLRPGYRGTLRVDVDTTIAINSLGMRGPEPAPKAAGDRRVLLLGDSIVWGYGVEADETFAARLGPRLSTAWTACATGNGGVPGYGSKHMAAQMARLDAPFGADAFVVCGYLGNDPLDDAAPRRTVFAGLMLQGAWARLVESSPRARLMYRSRAALWFESWLANAHPERSLIAQFRFLPEEDEAIKGFTPQRLFAGLFLDAIDEKAVWDAGAPPVIPRSLASLRGSLERMRGLAKGRPLVFVVMPTLWQVVEERRVARVRECGIDPATTERGLAQRRWLETAKAAGVPALDATPILAAAPDPAALFLSDGGHLSVAGHEAIAVWLAQELARLWR